MPQVQLFIFGVARSGTNMVARMLDAHPQLAVALDPLMPLMKLWRNLTVMHRAPAAIRSLFDMSSPFQDYYFSEDGPALLDLIMAAPYDLPVSQTQFQDLRRATQDRAALEATQLAKKFAGLNGSTIAEILASAFNVIGQEAGDRGKKGVTVVGTKEVWTIEFVFSLMRAFPAARFIIIHRDPRAVVASAVAMARKDSSQAAHTVSYLRHWRKHVAIADHLANSPETSRRVLAFRFEDALALPESLARQLAAFLDLPFSSDMLRLGDGTWSGNSSFGPLRAPIDSAASERWRDHLSSGIVEMIEFYCGPEMSRLGYVSLGQRNPLNEAVVEETLNAHATPGKWRSDSGDPMADLAWENLRHLLLDGHQQKWPEELVRRCFLFGDLYKRISASKVEH